MKKNFKCLAFMAAALLVGFSSCSNDNDASNVDAKTPKDVQIKVNFGTPTGYAEGPAQDGKNPVIFTSGNLFFTDAAGTIKAYFKIDSAEGTKTTGNTILLSDLTKDKGQKLTDLPGDITKVYLVGNTTLSSVTGNISNVLKESLEIDSQAATKDNNGVNTNRVNLYGEGKVDKIKDAEGTTNAQYEAKVTLLPTVARMELNSIKAKATGDIKSFKVEGIFINYYFPTASVNGTVGDPNTIKKHSQVIHFMNTYGGYAKSLMDWYTTPKASDADGVVSPTTAGDVWGYNVFASAAGSAVPRIVIRLSNIESKTGIDYSGTQFIVIKGLKENGTTDLDGIKAGSVYSLGAGLEFDQDNITVDPSASKIDVNVTVTVNPWNVVVVTPSL